MLAKKIEPNECPVTEDGCSPVITLVAEMKMFKWAGRLIVGGIIMLLLEAYVPHIWKSMNTKSAAAQEVAHGIASSQKAANK